MKQVLVNVEEEIKKVLPLTLKKDLQDNERICPTCHGLGMVATHRVYGIKDDHNPEVKGIHFPYDHQTLTFCPSCFNGVQTLCEYCGKPVQRGYISKCDCEQYKEKEAEEKRQKYLETISKAKEVKPEDVTTYLYDENSDKYYADVDSFVEEFECENGSLEDLIENLPDILWVTSEQKMSIDASNVIEDACSDLHEDASDNCDYESLQKVLDDWCGKQTGTTTYFPCYKEYIKVDKKWFSE
jgi:hypothetical protein